MKIKEGKMAAGEIISRLSVYIAESGEAELPAAVIRKAKHHILDTLGAIVCGSDLKPGRVAKKFAGQQGGAREAHVAGSPVVTTAINAAFAMAMMAHSDETDDSHERAGMHPGCGIVPAALAVADREEADGLRFLKGVVAGYDIGCRITQALGVENVRRRALSLHGIGSNFGAAAAAASVLGLKEELVRYVWDYTAQQDSGKYYWVRDTDHVEKAFVFAGMGARNGVTSAILVQSGFTGVADVFSGEHNYFESFSPVANRECLVEELGGRYEIQLTDIKKYSVGAPIQAPLDALLNLRGKHGLTAANVQSMVARVPDDRVLIVRDRNMPDVDLKHVLAVALLDGGMTFAASHSYERMKDPAVLAIRERITLVGDPELRTAKIKRGGIVEITTTDGAKLREHVELVRGRPGNPMSDEEIGQKCTDLMQPILGEERTGRLIDRIWNLEKVKNIRDLRPLLSVS
ncbi:MAG: MmgE/PrpD family protein [Syntrophus sp. (in: bacteria)]|nr:MmgE/PrpD family protein [Syntrophus sp. (in: bacteria)]